MLFIFEFFYIGLATSFILIGIHFFYLLVYRTIIIMNISKMFEIKNGDSVYLFILFLFAKH